MMISDFPDIKIVTLCCQEVISDWLLAGRRPAANVGSKVQYHLEEEDGP